MSIDRSYDSYAADRDIIPVGEVVPDHPCQVFDGPVADVDDDWEAWARQAADADAVESSSALAAAQQAIEAALAGD